MNRFSGGGGEVGCVEEAAPEGRDIRVGGGELLGKCERIHEASRAMALSREFIDRIEPLVIRCQVSDWVACGRSSSETRDGATNESTAGKLNDRFLRCCGESLSKSVERERRARRFSGEEAAEGGVGASSFDSRPVSNACADIIRCRHRASIVMVPMHLQSC